MSQKMLRRSHSHRNQSTDLQVNQLTGFFMSETFIKFFGQLKTSVKKLDVNVSICKGAEDYFLSTI